MGHEFNPEEKTPKSNKKGELTASAIKAIVEHPKLIPLFKKSLTEDCILMVCLEEDPTIFQYIPKPSLKVIKKGLELDGGNLRHIKKKVRKTLPSEFFLIALDSNPAGAIPYIPKDLIPAQVKEQLLMEDPDLLKQNNVDLVETAFLKNQIEEDPSKIKYIVNPSNELKCMALRKDPNIALYFDELTNEMMDIIDEMYPSIRESLPNYTRKNNITEG